jgi:hypothetical protein
MHIFRRAAAVAGVPVGPGSRASLVSSGRAHLTRLNPEVRDRSTSQMRGYRRARPSRWVVTDVPGPWCEGCSDTSTGRRLS